MEPAHPRLIIGLGGLTLATGLIDAATVIGLGVFAANMTGNITFLGFSLGGSAGYSMAASLAALLGFLLGSALAGRIIPPAWTKQHAGRGLEWQVVLLAAATAVTFFSHVGKDGHVAWVVLALLGLAMGFQNVVSLASPLPDMKTTVMTLTLAGLAADIARGRESRWGLRLTSVVLLLVGALVGAVLERTVGLTGPLAVATVVVALSALVLRSVRPGNSVRPGDSEGEG